MKASARLVLSRVTVIDDHDSPGLHGSVARSYTQPAAVDNPVPGSGLDDVTNQESSNHQKKRRVAGVHGVSFCSMKAGAMSSQSLLKASLLAISAISLVVLFSEELSIAASTEQNALLEKTQQLPVN